MNKGSDGKLHCMHGDLECAGNVQQLCVQAQTPPKKNYNWLYRYVLCNWDQGVAKIGAPGVLPTCLSKVGASPKAISAAQACTAGRLGASLAEANAARVASLGVKKSCTVFLDGTQRCVRDGGAWYSDKADCPGGSTPKDFVRSVCAAYAAKAPPGTPLPAACDVAATAHTRPGSGSAM